MLFVLFSSALLWAASPQENATAKLKSFVQGQQARQQADTILKLRIQKVSVKQKGKDNCPESHHVRIQGKVEDILKNTGNIKLGKTFRLQYTQSIYKCKKSALLDDEPPQKGALIEAYLRCDGNGNRCKKASRYGSFLAPQELQKQLQKNLQESGILAHCTDQQAVKQAALAGTLSQQQQECLQYSMRYTSLNQTKRAKLSSLLIEHAKKTKDRKKWMEFLSYHLEKISREDPKLVSSFALQLFRQKDRKNAMYWARIALENKHRLNSGQEYQRIVSGLYRLRSIASLSLWKEQSEQAEKDRYKQIALEAAQAWLEYIQATKQNAQEAKAHCLKLATSDQCH